jgi:hypothetical protein
MSLTPGLKRLRQFLVHLLGWCKSKKVAVDPEAIDVLLLQGLDDRWFRTHARALGWSLGTWLQPGLLLWPK